MKNIESKYLNIFRNSLFPNMLALSDGILHTDDGFKFPIHRYTLARKSEYFHTMFTGVNKDRREFRIPDISGDCLCDILIYLYTRDIVVTDKNITYLLIGSNYLLLTDMYMKIKQNLKACMTEGNCLKIFHAAYLTDDQDIIQESFKFMEKRFERIVADHQAEVEDLPANTLHKILSSSHLYVFNENAVWQVIVQWTQKNIEDRQSFIPQLLSSLAIEEIDEKLATEILHHEIIWNNPYMADLNNMISSQNFPNNRDILVQFMQNYYGDCLTCYRRIPQELFLMMLGSSYTKTPDGGLIYQERNANEKSGLYIIFDENADEYYKILDVDFRVAFLTVIEHNIFIFRVFEQIWLKFNLISMDWTPMENFTFGNSKKVFIVAAEACIYVFFKSHQKHSEYAYGLKIYNAETNVWFDGRPLHNITIQQAVAIGNGIFVVGYNDGFPELVLERFNVDTWECTLLPPPNHMYTHDVFAVVAYHKKLYLVGKKIDMEQSNKPILSAEVFDPETALWKILPDLPYGFSLLTQFSDHFGARVLQDLYIFGDYNATVVFTKWNELYGSWEKVEIIDDRRFLFSSHFTIEDADLIRMIAKRHRYPGSRT